MVFDNTAETLKTKEYYSKAWGERIGKYDMTLLLYINYIRY